MRRFHTKNSYGDIPKIMICGLKYTRNISPYHHQTHAYDSHLIGRPLHFQCSVAFNKLDTELFIVGWKWMVTFSWTCKHNTRKDSCWKSHGHIVSYQYIFSCTHISGPRTVLCLKEGIFSGKRCHYYACI